MILFAEPDKQEYPVRAGGYFPGFHLPNFSNPTQRHKSGKPGHISIVTSPFLANSKTPLVPHLLKKDSQFTPKNKKVVINIINNGGDTNNVSRIDLSRIIKEDDASNDGMRNIIQRLKTPLNELNSRTKRSSEDEGNKTETEGSQRSADLKDYIYYYPQDYQYDYDEQYNNNVVAENPKPVEPSQLLIGFGGSRSTTRIPFVKKKTSSVHLGVPDSTTERIQTDQFLQNIPLQDFSNLINLSQSINRKPLKEEIKKPVFSNTALNSDGNNLKYPQRPFHDINQQKLPSFPLADTADDYSEYDYNDYFGVEPVTTRKPYAPRYPYPRYPPYPYPVYPQYPAPAAASTSVSCNAGACAAAAAASAGSSSSSSTSSSSGGSGASSASSSSGFFGSSSSTSGRSDLASILAEHSFDEWNSFEALTDEEIEEHVKASSQTEEEKMFPVPGIQQPLLERRRRMSDEDANVMSRLTDFLNDDLDNLEENLENSNNPMIVHMNERVDHIMDHVASAMHHSGTNNYKSLK